MGKHPLLLWQSTTNIHYWLISRSFLNTKTSYHMTKYHRLYDNKKQFYGLISVAIATKPDCYIPTSGSHLNHDNSGFVCDHHA